MDGFGREILKELLGTERKIAQPVRKAKQQKDEPPHADHWSAAVLMERAAYLRKLAKHSDGQAVDDFSHPRQRWNPAGIGG